MMAAGATFKYFAFGSNLLRERLLVQNPSAKFVGVGRLNDYRFNFENPVTKSKAYWFGAVANIRDSPSDYVMGVVWELSMEDSDSLNEQEQHYKAIQVPVILTDGTTQMCRTYTMDEDVTGDSLPDPYYKKVVVTGAKQNGLPKDYVAVLESFEDTKDTTVPLGYNRVLEVFRKIHGSDKDLESVIPAN